MNRLLAPTFFAAAMLFAAPAGAMLFAAPAGAVPNCEDYAPNTRICRSPGHTAITTTPNPSNPLAGWGFGGVGLPVFGLGGGGIWLGF